MTNVYAAVPESDISELEHRRKIAKAVNSVRAGKLNAVTTLTLTVSSATTIITDKRITPSSFIGFMPQTANAAAALATTYILSTNQLNGSATISHANDANADKTFTLLIIG